MGLTEATITLTLTPAEAQFLSWCVTRWQIDPDRLASADRVLMARELLERLKPEVSYAPCD